MESTWSRRYGIPGTCNSACAAHSRAHTRAHSMKLQQIPGARRNSNQHAAHIRQWHQSYLAVTQWPAQAWARGTGTKSIGCNRVQCGGGGGPKPYWRQSSTKGTCSISYHVRCHTRPDAGAAARLQSETQTGCGRTGLCHQWGRRPPTAQKSAPAHEHATCDDRKGTALIMHHMAQHK